MLQLLSIASASSSCIEWVQLSEGEAIPSNLLVSGANQGKSPQTFCRYAALDYSPMELTIGKFTVPKSKAWSSSPCFFAGSAAAGASVVQNGTISGGYELATIPAGNSCNVSFVETQVAAPAPPGRRRSSRASTRTAVALVSASRWAAKAGRTRAFLGNTSWTVPVLGSARFRPAFKSISRRRL
jgi:hypothetical protein